MHSTAQAAVLKDGIYIIQMAGSDMTAAATSEKHGSPMILWPYRPTATWVFKHLGNDVYTVRTNSTVLDLEGGKNQPGVSIIVWPPNNGDNQRWKLKKVGSMYHFVSVKTGQAMTLSNGKRTKGSRLQGQKLVTGSQNQLFCIQKSSAPRFCGGSGSSGGNQQFLQPEENMTPHRQGEGSTPRRQNGRPSRSSGGFQ